MENGVGLAFNQIKDKILIKRPLFIVHSDVCGSITPLTIDNKNYFVLLVDQYTHYCYSQIGRVLCFKDFVAKSETKCNLKLVNLYCDNGEEYFSTEMKKYTN